MLVCWITLLITWQDMGELAEVQLAVIAKQPGLTLVAALAALGHHLAVAIEFPALCRLSGCKKTPAICRCQGFSFFLRS